MGDTFWWLLAKYREKPTEGYLAGSREEDRILHQNHLFGSNAAKEACERYEKCLVSCTSEISLCALHQFDAVGTHAVDCFLNVIGDVSIPNKTASKRLRHKLGRSKGCSFKRRCSDVEIIHQESALELMFFLLIATISSMDSCFKIFEKRAVPFGVHAEKSFFFVKPAGSKIVRLQNRGRQT